jgi:hypothetical protein
MTNEEKIPVTLYVIGSLIATVFCLVLWWANADGGVKLDLETSVMLDWPFFVTADAGQPP